MYSNDMWVNNRNRVIARENQIFSMAENGQAPFNMISLHLGCGPRVLPGFVNVDKYYQHPDIINYDIFQLPQDSGTVGAIYCSHVLEHLPLRHAQLAVSEWARVMRPGGELFLCIPDIEYIMYKLLDQTITDYRREWLMYTLFGFQTDPNNTSHDLNHPVDHGQFHTCGFSRKTISDLLTRNNFKINEIYNYDGWMTPSIWIEAVRNEN